MKNNMKIKIKVKLLKAIKNKLMILINIGLMLVQLKKVIPKVNR